MAKVIELRKNLPIAPAKIREVCPSWPEKDFDSSWIKRNVDSIEVTMSGGMDGDKPGFPAHIEDYLNRVVLVFHQDNYTKLNQLNPTAEATLIPGGLGENMLVNHPSLAPGIICCGDVFTIGTAEFQVTGPRKACYKMAFWHKTNDLKDHVNQKGLGGYFLRVLKEGSCRVGDEIILLARPNPGFTIARISEGLYHPELRDDSVEFLTALANMETLIIKGYKDLASKRLKTIKPRQLEEKEVSSFDERYRGLITMGIIVIALFTLSIVSSSPSSSLSRRR